MPNKVQCPCCGEWLLVGAERAPTFDFARGAVTMHERLRPVPGLGIVDGALIPETWQEMRTEQPAREPTIAGDVLVPLQQAAITGVLVGALAIVPVAGLHGPWWAVPFVGLLTTTLAWGYTVLDGRRLLRRIEQVSREIVAGLEPVTAPAAPARHDEMTVTVINNPPGSPDDGKIYTGGVMRDYHLPVNDPQFKAVVAAVANGGKWAERALSGKTGLSDTQIAALLEAMLAAGFLRYRNGQRNHPQGYELTPVGHSVVRKIQAAADVA